MNKIETEIDGVYVIEPRVFGDVRGFFVESFSAERYAEALGVSPNAFVQDNLSRSAKGVLRGLHFQKAPHAQGKLVSVLAGRVYDVAVDLRIHSSTYGKHVGIELAPPSYDAENNVWSWRQFWIPAGFAHGFVALEDDTLFAYKCAHNIYAPTSDAGVRWNSLDIMWPFAEYGIDAPCISDKDAQLPVFEDLRGQNFFEEIG